MAQAAALSLIRPLGLAALMALAGCASKPTPLQRGMAAYQEGYAALQAGDYAKAERVLEEAARLAPDDPYTQLDLGVAEQKLGKLDEARVAYTRAAELGRKLMPVEVTDPRFAGRTIEELAKEDLATLPNP